MTTEKKVATKKTTTKATSKKVAKTEKQPVGRKAAYSGKKITKLVSENPRREGSIGHESFKLIKNGMSYEQYIAAGGRLIDLKYDVDHKYVKVA